MNKIIGDFVQGVDIISSEMKAVTPSFDMTKAQMAFQKAMANNQGQYEALDVFLSTIKQN